MTAEGHTALPETPTGLTKVFVDYLPKRNDNLKEDLEVFFNCGKIVTLLKKPGKTFGYVVFRKPNSARAALRKNRCEFQGRELRVEVPKGITERAEPKKESYRSRIAKLTAVDYEKQVYLDHLAPPVNEEILRSVVKERVGTDCIESAKFMGKKNCCFLTLNNKDDVAKVVKKLNGYGLLGQQLVATPAQKPGTIDKSKKPSTPTLSPGDGPQPADAKGGTPKKPKQAPPRCSSVLVGGLPEDVRIAELEKVFSTHGNIRTARLIRNRVTGYPTGVAFVKFDNPQSAQKALAMDGMEVPIGRGVVIQVELDTGGPSAKDDEGSPKGKGEPSDAAVQGIVAQDNGDASTPRRKLKKKKKTAAPEETTTPKAAKRALEGAEDEASSPARKKKKKKAGKEPDTPKGEPASSETPAPKKGKKQKAKAPVEQADPDADADSFEEVPLANPAKKKVKKKKKTTKDEGQPAPKPKKGLLAGKATAKKKKKATA